MSDTDLGELWAATGAPSFDPAFTLALEERIARRVMLIDVAGCVAAGLALVVGLVAFGPALLARLAALAGSVDAAGPVLAAVAVLGAGMIRLMRTGETQDLEDSGGSPTGPS